MGLGSYLKHKFGSKDEGPRVYSSLNIKINSILQLNLICFLTNDEDLVMNDPGETLTVTEVGTTSIFDTKVFHVYGKNGSGDEYCLQIVEDNTGKIGDMTLFTQISEDYPNDWDHIHQLMDHDWYGLQDDQLVYDKVWGVTSYEETVEGGVEEYTYPAQGSLFVRDVNEDGLKEFCLVTVEEEKRLCEYVGLDITVSDITVI